MSTAGSETLLSQLVLELDELLNSNVGSPATQIYHASKAIVAATSKLELESLPANLDRIVRKLTKIACEGLSSGGDNAQKAISELRMSIVIYKPVLAKAAAKAAA